MLQLKWEQGNSLSVSHSVIWETDGDCGKLLAPIPSAGCRCGEAILTLLGQEGSVWGVEVHVPGDLWTHHIRHTHTHTEAQAHLALCPHAFMESALTRTD